MSGYTIETDQDLRCYFWRRWYSRRGLIGGILAFAFLGAFAFGGGDVVLAVESDGCDEARER